MFIKDLKVGMIIKSSGQVGVIRDVLTSSETENSIVNVSFVHNVGNSRTYDILEVKKGGEALWGIDKWEETTKAVLEKEIDKRKKHLESVLSELVLASKEKVAEK